MLNWSRCFDRKIFQRRLRARKRDHSVRAQLNSQPVDLPPTFAGITFRGTTRRSLEIPASGLKLVFPVNAELILKAQDHPEFRAVLSRNWSTFDGFWPYLIARLKLSPPIEKISGSEFVHDIFAHAAREQMKVFLLGAKPEINDGAQQAVRRRYGIEVEGYSPRYEPYPYCSATTEAMLEAIQRARPQILLAALGAPKQELWLDSHQRELVSAGVRLGMAVGGTLEMLAGVYRKAPSLVCSMGLEGVWRVLLDPKRIRRFPNPFRFFRLALLS